MSRPVREGFFGSFWDNFAHFSIILGLLWVYESYFGVTLACFQNVFIFPKDFNDFIKLGGGFAVDLGLFWGHFWHMKVTLGPLWGHFGHIDVE